MATTLPSRGRRILGFGAGCNVALVAGAFRSHEAGEFGGSARALAVLLGVTGSATEASGQLIVRKAGRPIEPSTPAPPSRPINLLRALDWQWAWRRRPPPPTTAGGRALLISAPGAASWPRLL